MSIMMIPIVVTLVGIVTDVSDVHCSKAQASNDSVKYGDSVN